MAQNLLTAIALMLVLEGILPFLNPEALRRALLQVANLDARSLRIGGFVSMVLGLGLLYLARH